MRVQLHALGPRVFIVGVRVHEWHLGLAVISFATVLALAARIHGRPALALGLGGLWLVAKDWRDLTPSRRDSGAWSLGPHRPPLSLRPAARGYWVAPASALLVLLTACANLVSALTPDIRWRGHLVRTFEPVEAAAVFHALAVPASAVLIVAAFFLWRRRRRAWAAAVGLLLALGFANLLKGLDVEEAALSWAAAGVLVWGRPSFAVRPHRLPLSACLAGAAAIGAGALALAAVASEAAVPHHAAFDLVARCALDMVAWQSPPIAFGDEMRLIPDAVGAVSLFALLAATWLLFRPLPASSEPPAEPLRRRARDLVRGYGADTLAFFKLRDDKRYLFSPDGQAFLGYRDESRVMVVSGDPVGAAAAIPQLIVAAVERARAHDLRLAIVGASPELLPLYRQAGLRALYIGDEAIVDTAAFSLEGRAIRKVRQSVARVERAGYRVSAVRAADADGALLAELEDVSALWRGAAAERGFSMALDRLGGPGQEDTVLVLAHDAGGCIAGFIHFVPSYGRPAMSLTAMRRRPETPNGLMEALIVHSVLLLREQGIEELSLNFAAFGRYLRAPRGPAERALARGLRLADRWFQIERLHRFNAKFQPRWRPRYLVFDGVAGLPRCALSVLWLEGQAPRPPAPWRARSRRRRRPTGPEAARA